MPNGIHKRPHHTVSGLRFVWGSFVEVIHTKLCLGKGWTLARLALPLFICEQLVLKCTHSYNTKQRTQLPIKCFKKQHDKVFYCLLLFYYFSKYIKYLIIFF